MYFNVFVIFTIILYLHRVDNADVDKSSWIDPHDLSELYEASDIEDDGYEDVQLVTYNSNEKCSQEDRSAAYLKRVMHMLLNIMYEDPYDDSIYQCHLIIKMDMQKYNALREAIENPFLDLVKIDQMLTDILQKPSEAYMEEYLLSWAYKIIRWCCSRTGIICISFFTYLFVIYKLLSWHSFCWDVFKFLLFNIVISDFIITWIALYQKAEMDKAIDSLKYKDIPVYCNPEKMSLVQTVLNMFSYEDKCKMYFHSSMIDVFWTISPLMVVAEVINNFFSRLIRLKAIGKAFGDLVSGILHSLPWGINIILLPALLVFFAIILCICLSFILRVPLKFNFFHLISFTFGDTGYSARGDGNVLTGNTVDKLLDIVKEQNNPRIFIEEVQTKKNQLPQNEKTQLELKGNIDKEEKANDAQCYAPEVGAGDMKK